MNETHHSYGGKQYSVMYNIMVLVQDYNIDVEWNNEYMYDNDDYNMH